MYIVNLNIKSKFFVFIIGLLVIFMFVTGKVAVACDKTQFVPVQALKQADVVFSGKVENLQYLDSPEKTKTEPRIIVTFKVLESWKSEVKKNVVIHTTHNKFSCNGFNFESAGEYLVYASFNKRADNFFARLFSPDKPRLGVKAYSGTKLLAEAVEDLRFLRNQRHN